jgi:hypothetical protein
MPRKVTELRHPGSVTVRAVFAFEGNDVAVFRTVGEAASHAEVYDTDASAYFTDDGTKLVAAQDGSGVSLQPAPGNQFDDLLARLRHTAAATDMSLPDGYADDPMSYARAFRPGGWHSLPKATRRARKRPAMSGYSFPMLLLVGSIVGLASGLIGSVAGLGSTWVALAAIVVMVPAINVFARKH